MPQSSSLHSTRSSAHGSGWNEDSISTRGAASVEVERLKLAREGHQRVQEAAFSRTARGSSVSWARESRTSATLIARIRHRLPRKTKRSEVRGSLRMVADALPMIATLVDGGVVVVVT
jgi:hypothetical protein